MFRGRDVRGLVLLLALGGVPALAIAPGTALAGPTERACLKADRSPGSRVCACVQSIADQTLSGRDQRRAAQFVSDPDEFEAFLKKDARDAKAFVQRYRRWGKLSEQYCRG